MKSKIMTLVLIVLLATPSVSFAGIWDILRDRSEQIEAEEGYEDVDFDFNQKRKIQRYYGKQRRTKHKGRRGLPPGLAKKHHSHPGVQAHLRKGTELSDEEELYDLPSDLEGILDELPDGVVRKRVDNAIVLVDRARKILDIIQDIE